MATDRIQRRIDRLLDQIEQEADQDNWQRVFDLAKQVLGFAPENSDAQAFLGVAEERLSASTRTEALEPIPPSMEPQAADRVVVADQPTSFANGRYQVKEFLGEGGKKKVYPAHDTVLDGEVAFALIKAKGLVYGSGPTTDTDGRVGDRRGAGGHISGSSTAICWK